MNKPQVIDKVVENDLCIGCGMCESQCPSNALTMTWDDYGFLKPELTGSCNSDGTCLSVCPFNPIPKDGVKTEDEISELFLNDTFKHHKKLGKYIGLYAGYSNDFRLSSSSGGIATFVLKVLLERDVINHVISVKNSEEEKSHYEYRISSSVKELIESSKTKYYPVTLGEVFSKVEKLQGKVAVTGVPCFIKAIRLAQHHNPQLKIKLEFLIGIFCGGVKSRFFTEYLASKVGIEKNNIKQPEYRIKDIDSEANDYSFGSIDEETQSHKTLKMRSVGDMWGSGMFKANACDFCDDVTSELADLSIGDAWIQPYINDGRGTNVIITRSKISEQILMEGLQSGEVFLDKISEEKMAESQSGGFNHRHNGLKYRIKDAKRHGKPVPPKRHGNKEISFDFKIVQKIRSKVRRKSLEVWKDTQNARDYDNKMKTILSLLRFVTRMNHRIRRIRNKFKL